MPETKKVGYAGKDLGEITVYGVGDWTNKDRPATEKDLRLINATAAADFVFEALKREPLKVCEEEPDQPWVTVLLRVACTASLGMRDERMEEQTLMLYVNRHGMNQILEIWGTDVGRLAEELAKLSGVDDIPGDDEAAVENLVVKTDGDEGPAPGAVPVPERTV